jgi:hypothetical protein
MPHKQDPTDPWEGFDQLTDAPLVAFMPGVDEHGAAQVRAGHAGTELGVISPVEALAIGVQAIEAAIEAERDEGFVLAMRAVNGSMEEIATMLALVAEYRPQAMVRAFSTRRRPRPPGEGEVAE